MANYRQLKFLWSMTCLLSMMAAMQCLAEAAGHNGRPHSETMREIHSVFKLMRMLVQSTSRRHIVYAGDSCVAGEADGTCKRLKDCAPLWQEVQMSASPMPPYLRRKLNSLRCGFDNDEALICCSEQTNLYNQGTGGTSPVAPKPVSNPIAPRPVSNPFTNEDDGTTINKSGTDVASRNKVPADVRNHRNIDLLPTNCGLTESDRILGGNRTSLYEMPWMALISYTSPRGVQLSCGGTLINEWYVLTAAHCVSFLGNRLKLAGVVIGEYDIRSDPDCERIEGDLQCASSFQNMSIAEVIAHPGYSPQNLSDDIALIRLSREADLTLQSLKPICLPITPDLQGENLIGKKGLVAGWGATEDGLQSPVLLSVALPILRNEDCENAYKTNISDQQFCAGGEQGKDSCAGDSGGPIMYEGKVSNLGVRKVQRGIVSFGSKRCGIGGFPGIYTNVAYYMDWILDNMHE